MSQRAIRRAQQRRAASDERRGALRRRRAVLATGAAIGASALLAPAAGAANFQVTNTNDGPVDACTDDSCTLRDAIDAANANGGTGIDTITFASGVTGTITLTEGPLMIGTGSTGEGFVSIQGPGAASLSISGGDASRVFRIANYGRALISGVTITGGLASRGAGVDAGPYSAAALTDAIVTGNDTTNSYGGGLASRGSLTLNRTTVSGNTASSTGGGIAFRRYTSGSIDQLNVIDSTISGNYAEDGGGGISAEGTLRMSGSTVTDNATDSGGGGVLSSDGELSIATSTISGNVADSSGGGILQASGKYGAMHVSDSDVSGNEAARGGGIGFFSGYSKYASHSTIERTTVAGNQANQGSTNQANQGGGIDIGSLKDNGSLTISHSTISGNATEENELPGNAGGGINVRGPIRGYVDVLDSTVSGNSARTGGGVNVGGGNEQAALAGDGSIAFRGSTIASNTATETGGGIYLDAFRGREDDPPVTVQLNSTIVGDNTVSDLDRADDSTAGGFDLSFSLVETPTADATLTQAPPGSSIIGADPQLGPLADNGGPTLTHLPARTSPAIEKGHGDPEDTDQRGEPRVVDNDDPNPAGGNGTDIGAVELDKPPPQPMPPGDPPPDNPPPGDPPPDDPPPPQTTPQDLPPQALIKHNGLRSKKKAKRYVSGVADDDRTVRSVDVAIVRKRGRLCRELLPSGKFSKAVRCHGPTSFLRAEGTGTWRFDLKERLDRGYYVVYSRATDDAGQEQLSFGTKSRRPFRVR